MLGLSFILTCAVCRRPWVSAVERWRAYHVGDDLDEPAELVFYCPNALSASSAAPKKLHVFAPMRLLTLEKPRHT
jgi:hypothetical protein